MKKPSDKSWFLFLAPRIILPLMAVALILALALPGRITKTETTTYAVPEGCSFHVDVKLRLGEIRLTVTDDTGSTLLDDTFDASYNYAVTAPSAGEYTLTAEYNNAYGSIETYLTDESGTRVNFDEP
jgi:hypothetical protein